MSSSLLTASPSGAAVRWKRIGPRCSERFSQAIRIQPSQPLPIREAAGFFVYVAAIIDE
jgi:hypothetical protein